MTGKTAYPLFLLCIALGLAGCVTKETYSAQVLRTNNFQRLLAEEEKRSVELSAEIAKLKDQAASLEAKNKTLTAQLNDAKAQVVRSLEEVGRLQDEVKQARGGFSSAPALRGPSQEPPDRLGELLDVPAAKPEKKVEKKKGKAPTRQDASQEPPDRLSELQAAPAEKSEKKVASKKGKPTAQVRMLKQSEVSPPQPEVVLPVPTPPPPQAQPQAKTEAAPDESFFRYHKVKKGETLAGIAKQYRTDAQTLRELNDMALGDAIKPGDRLIVGQKP